MKSSHAALAVVGLALAGLWYAGGGAAVPSQSAAAAEARVSAPVAHDNLAVYFIHGPDAVANAKIATLQEALDAGWAVVHETGTVNTLAVNSPDLSAGVAYYGMQPKAEDVPKIKAALLLHYAGLDERIDAGIDAYKKALDAAHVDYTVYVYDGVNHAFNNDTSAARYDKKAADLAWGRTIAFLKEKLA